MKYQKLFSPVKVGSVTLKNRFAMAPMVPSGWLMQTEAGIKEVSTIIRSVRKEEPD